MPLPKRRTSRSKVRKRRGAKHLKIPNVTYCPKCSAPTLPHRVCPECGFYHGRAVIEVEEK